MSDRRNEFPPSVNVGKLYERTSAAGNQYISGFFGSMKITLLKSKDADAEGNPIWNLMIAASPSRDRAGNAAGRFDRSAETAKGSKAEAERPREVSRIRSPMQSHAPGAQDVGEEIPF